MEQAFGILRIIGANKVNGLYSQFVERSRSRVNSSCQDYTLDYFLSACEFPNLFTIQCVYCFLRGHVRCVFCLCLVAFDRSVASAIFIKLRTRWYIEQGGRASSPVHPFQP